MARAKKTKETDDENAGLDPNRWRRDEINIPEDDSLASIWERMREEKIKAETPQYMNLPGGKETYYQREETKPDAFTKDPKIDENFVENVVKSTKEMMKVTAPAVKKSDDFGEIEPSEEEAEFILERKKSIFTMQMGRKWLSFVDDDGNEMRDMVGFAEYFKFGKEWLEENGDLDFKLFLLNLRLKFMEEYSVFLNCLMLPTRYAKMKGVSLAMVYRWMNTDKLDVVEIDKVKFILTFNEDYREVSRFLLENALQEDVPDMQAKREYDRNLRVYQRNYLSEGVIPAPENTVLSWVRYEKMHTDKEEDTGMGIKCARFTTEAYADYRKYCGTTGKNSVPMITFSERMVELGFKKFVNKRRGFYFYYWEKPGDWTQKVAKTHLEAIERYR